MADEKYLDQAKIAYGTLCQALDRNEWHYTKNEENLSIECGARGDDLPMNITIEVDAMRGLVMLISPLPFGIQEDKRIDVALAVSAINNVLADGCFDYDVSTGNMFFRMTNSFIGSTLGEDVFSYLLFCACGTVDDYNDKFLMISKGMISVEQFIASLND